MSMFAISKEAKKAILIGGMCSLSYLAVYVARNVLGVASPQMIESGEFTTESIGVLSSIFFITYAVGQLINGMIGDKIKTKYMVSLGLALAGVASFVFTIASTSITITYIAYGMLGFFLSMIYGPMTKVVAENTMPIHATRCSMGYEFAALLGSPLAGILASLLVWKGAFNVSSVILIVMGCLCFATFSLFEKKRIIVYNQYHNDKENKKSGSIRTLIEHQIIKFTLISMITGVVRTAVVFWLPTYLSQHLGFSPENSALIFTLSTFAISLTAFIAIFLYECLNRNMDIVILIGFSASAICFLSVFLLKQPILNILFMVLAIMSSNCAAAMLWSRYCPSLRDTGMVSSATGYLDFISYMAASISSTLFANAVSDVGWGNLILIWFALMILGVVVALPYDKLKKQKQKNIENT